VVEAVNGNIRLLINRSRGYKNPRYLLLSVRRLAVSMKKAAKCHFLRIPAQRPISRELLRAL
jgi:hypothetical protein